ncbi:amidohydrolase family protein [Chloroflexota bacterium]
MITDFHTHIFSTKVKENRSKYLQLDPSFAELYSNPRAKIITAEELISSMDNVGIDGSVVLNINWCSHELCVESNDYILDAVARYPHRLIGFGSILPGVPETAIMEIERCVKGGMKGIGEIRPDSGYFDIQSDSIAIVIDALIRYRLILLTHASEPVGHQYPGKGKVTPDVLYQFITRFPELLLVCAHWGGGLPFYALMPEVKKALKNVYFDSAASSFLYIPEIYNKVIELVGSDKVLFGSDYPVLGQNRLLEEIVSSLDEDNRQRVLYRNAEDLLGINGVRCK